MPPPTFLVFWRDNIMREDVRNNPSIPGAFLVPEEADIDGTGVGEDVVDVVQETCYEYKQRRYEERLAEKKE